MKKLTVWHNKNGRTSQTMNISCENTTASLRQMIKEGLKHAGSVSMYFHDVGGNKEILDEDMFSEHFPNGLQGATIYVDLNSDPQERGSDKPENGLSNDVKIDDNLCNDEALQYNFAVGLDKLVEGRPTMVTIVKNQAGDYARQSNAVLSDKDSLQVLVNAMKPKA
ncbi:hypothetical protein F4679DRAFT_544500 [Xylaria curta]|nr:hypothetical protein F4679DRAFT_544500 [Xylaria curta]